MQAIRIPDWLKDFETLCNLAEKEIREEKIKILKENLERNRQIR